MLLAFLTASLMFNFFTKPDTTKDSIMDLYEISINSLEGEPITLSDYKGKKILFVNVASKCGFTPQYVELEELHQKFGDKLQIIGVPCNQFGEQEPGTSNEIKDFCQKNYGVSFLLTEKIEVKGENQHPLYKWLTHKELNGRKNSKVEWNFQKYLVDETGQLLDFFLSITSPTSEKITKLL